MIDVHYYQRAVADILRERMEQLGWWVIPRMKVVTVLNWFRRFPASVASPYNLYRAAHILRIEITISRDSITYETVRRSCAIPLPMNTIREQRQRQFREARMRAPKEVRHSISARYNTPQIRSLLKLLAIFPDIVIVIGRGGVLIENLDLYAVLQTKVCKRCRQPVTLDRFEPLVGDEEKLSTVCNDCRFLPPVSPQSAAVVPDRCPDPAEPPAPEMERTARHQPGQLARTPNSVLAYVGQVIAQCFRQTQTPQC